MKLIYLNDSELSDESFKITELDYIHLQAQVLQNKK